MNNQLEKLKKRVSSRSFLEYELNSDEINSILEGINNSPSHSNHQLFTAILVLDKEKRSAISKKLYSQKQIVEGSGYILFLADRSRNNEICNETHICSSMSTFEFIRSFMDATIASSYAQSVLMSMGFGSCYIGAQFTLKDFYKETLNIHDSAFPVVALAFGKVSEENKFKPKLKKVFIDSYKCSVKEGYLEEYNNCMKQYFEKDRSKNIDFFDHVKSFYENKYYVDYSKKASSILEEEIKNLIK